MSLTVQRFLAEEKQRVYLKKAFQSYVAPDVVNEIIKTPGTPASRRRAPGVDHSFFRYPGLHQPVGNHGA